MNRKSPKSPYLLAIGLLLSYTSVAQITGGQYAFEYLRLPNSAHVSALGGINVAHPSTDISLAGQNPALMRPALHNQVAFNYNSFYSGISHTNVNYGYYLPKIGTAFAVGVQYLNYGNFQQTDNMGNTLGTFNATDYSLQLSASRQYKERWRYGATLKFAQSRLADYNAIAVLGDVGIVYEDTANLLTIGAVAKNMGAMAKPYTTGRRYDSEPMPFDLQIGISKKLKHIPFRMFATIHHLNQWDIRYDNPNDRTSNVFGSVQDTSNSKSYFADKLFRHFIFGGEITIAKRLAVNVAYNHLRRKELSLDEVKGSVGYSFGASLYLNKFQIHYARAAYSLAGAYNEFGLNVQLNKLISGNSTWKATYANWEM